MSQIVSKENEMWPAGLKSMKNELRTFMKKSLAVVSSESINHQSNRIFQTLKNNPLYQNARRISVYLSMPSGEVQTDMIVRDALNCGKQVFIPYIFKTTNKPIDSPQSMMEMVKIFSISDYESLKRDKWGIPSIDPKTIDQREKILHSSQELDNRLDLILLPGVAFESDPITNFFKRLGHGKGFYDYFLRQYKTKFQSGCDQYQTQGVQLYGLSLKEQYLSEDGDMSVPIDKHDCLLNALIVGDGRFLKATDFKY